MHFPLFSLTLGLSINYHSLLQVIFPTQGSKLGLLHQILYHLSHQGSPIN